MRERAQCNGLFGHGPSTRFFLEDFHVFQLQERPMSVELCSITDDFIFSRLDNGQLSSLDLPTTPFRIERFVHTKIHRSSNHLFLVDSAQLFAISLAARAVRRLPILLLRSGPFLSIMAIDRPYTDDRERGRQRVLSVRCEGRR